MANKSNELIGGAKKNKELIGLAVAAGTGAILEYIYVKAKGKKGTNANANANQNKQNPKSGKATIQNKKNTNQKNKGLTTERATRSEVENLIVNISIDSTAAGGNLRKGSDVVEKDNAKVEIMEKKSGTGLVDKVKDNLDDTKSKPESDFIKKDNAKLEKVEKKSGIDNANLKIVEEKYGTGFHGTGLVDRVKEKFKLSNDDMENKKKSN